MKGLLSLLMLGVLSGCQIGAQTGPLVVDVAKVGEALDRAVFVQKETKKLEKQLTEEVQALAEQLKQQLIEMKASLGETPGNEEQAALAVKVNQLNQHLEQNKNKARLMLQQHQLTLNRAFLKRISNVADKIAVSKGGKVVLAKNDALLWHDATLDITTEVIDALKSEAQ
jgi:Skp family chaperone for outer membrane proteins